MSRSGYERGLADGRALVQSKSGMEWSDANVLRLIAKDHERLAPNAYHSAEALRHIADRLSTLAQPSTREDEA